MLILDGPWIEDMKTVKLWPIWTILTLFLFSERNDFNLNQCAMKQKNRHKMKFQESIKLSHKNWQVSDKNIFIGAYYSVGRPNRGVTVILFKHSCKYKINCNVNYDNLDPHKKIHKKNVYHNSTFVFQVFRILGQLNHHIISIESETPIHPCQSVNIFITVLKS